MFPSHDHLSFLLVTPNSLINNYAHKWNLNTLAWDGNIGTEVTNYRPSDMLVLADDTIIICYYRDADRRDTIIRRYNLAGAQLNTISIPTAEQISATPRLGYARNRGYFWVWIPKVNGVSLLKKFLASDFSLSVDTAVPNVYQSSIEQANPSLIYVSDSCPIIELRTSLVGRLH